MSQYMRIIVMCWWLWLCSLAQDFRKKRFYIYIIAVGLKPTETEVWREIVWKVCIQSQPTTEYVAVNHNCLYCWPCAMWVFQSLIWVQLPVTRRTVDIIPSFDQGASKEQLKFWKKWHCIFAVFYLRQQTTTITKVAKTETHFLTYPKISRYQFTSKLQID